MAWQAADGDRTELRHAPAFKAGLPGDKTLRQPHKKFRINCIYLCLTTNNNHALKIYGKSPEPVSAELSNLHLTCRDDIDLTGRPHDAHVEPLKVFPRQRNIEELFCNK
jgi:hypothetical protein